MEITKKRVAFAVVLIALVGVVFVMLGRDANPAKEAQLVTGDQIIKKIGKTTEMSLPNPPEIVSKPSIGELKEFRKKSEELKQKVEETKTQGRAGTLTVGIGGTDVAVEPLYTYEDQTKGLLGRDSLPQDAGMLYIFQMDDAGRLFGTKGMKFSIDLIWLNSDSMVVHMHKNVPPDFDGNLKSVWPARFVLETNAGFAARYGIRVGDTIDISKIPH